MPLIQEHKAIFLHIPKTGGTSVERFFKVTGDNKDNLWMNRNYNIIKDAKKITSAPQHYPLSIVHEKRPDVCDWFTFTIIRHPYQRILSEYFWRNNRGDNRGKFRFIEDDFNDWLNNKLKFVNDHSMPQSWFIDKRCHLILRQEKLKEEIEKYLFPILKINRQFIQINNQTLNKYYPNQEELSQETKDNIYMKYMDDFKRFGFKR